MTPWVPVRANNYTSDIFMLKNARGLRERERSQIIAFHNEDNHL